MARIIKKDKVADLFAKLNDYDVYAPVVVDGIPDYKLIEPGTAPELEFGNSKKPPKGVFFPQTETMFDLTVEGHRFTGAEEPKLSDKPMLLFGARPCDARAMTYLDELFSWDYIDKYYNDRRKDSTTVALTCAGERPNENCFCTSIGGNPAGTEGVDMLWTDIGPAYFVESFSDNGEKLISAGGDLFTDADNADEISAKAAKEEAENQISKQFDPDGLAEALDCLFGDPYWEQYSERCLGCGICTLLCPTCHCFDINDIVSKGEGRRERTWDSCQFPYYTAHASGHNPRPAKMHRQRNRLYHKFLYINKNLGIIGCVGCGRCITQCPVNIDIVEVAEGAKACVEKGGD